MSQLPNVQLRPVRRVLMTADAVGDVWTYAMQLSRVLCSSGVEVVLATMGPPPSQEQRQECAGIDRLSLEVGEYALEWMDEPWQDVDRAGAWLLDIKRRTDPDIIHLNGYSHAGLDWDAPVLTVAHSCALSWWTNVLSEPAPERYAEYRRRASWGLAACDIVVAPTQAMLRELEQHFGGIRRSRVISNGIDLGAWSAGRKLPQILSAGGICDRAKNLELLLDIESDLVWPVRIAGEHRRPNGVEVNASVASTLLGPISRIELRNRLSIASIYAHPVLYEPFGLAPLEAAASGCALVLADLPSLREVWQKAACFVPPHDRGAWRDALNALATDTHRRTQMAIRARRQASEYSAERMAARYLALYHELKLQRAAAPSAITMPPPAEQELA
jgi:glycosyltransferase involved in cell wall biosynthesis